MARGGANLLQNLFEGMMAGALIGTAGAAISGLASMSASSFTWGSLGRGALQLGKNFLVNIAESFSTFGLVMRGAAGTQNVLATYGETGEMDAQTFDKAFTDGFWSPEIGAVQSAQNIASGKGTWQDYGGMILMFSPVGEGKRQVLDGEQPRVTVDADGLGRNADNMARNADDAPTAKVDGDDTPAKPRSADADVEPAKPSEDGVPLELGNNKVGTLGENSIAENLRAEGYEVIQVQNRSGHGVDIIARDAQGNVRCIEVKANTSQLSDAQRQGGRSFVQDRLNRATSNKGHYKVPPNSEDMVNAANDAKDWISDAPNVEYEVRRVDVDRTTGEVSNERVEPWDPKPRTPRR